MGDVLLTVAVCITQLALGGMGVLVSLKPPPPQHHKPWITGFILIGLTGIVLTGWLAKRAEDAQLRASGEIHQAEVAATNANTAATNANAAATEAGKETKAARQEAYEAQQKLSDLINKRSKETTQALLKLNTTTESSVKGIGVPRRIPKEMMPKLIADLSVHKGVVTITAVGGDRESVQFANDWYGVLSLAGWTITGGIDADFVPDPLTGVRVTVRGEPINPKETFTVSAEHPANALGHALFAITSDVIGQRKPDLADNAILLDIGVLPRPQQN